MLDLALQDTRLPVSIKSIAARQGISVDYLEQLFNRLRRAGIVEAARGPKGGVSLRRPAGKINIMDILITVQEPLEPVYCLEKADKFRTCNKVKDCVPRMLWQRLSNRIRDCLEEITLADLAKEAKSRPFGKFVNRR